MWAPETGHQDKSLPRRFSSSPNHVLPAIDGRGSLIRVQDRLKSVQDSEQGWSYGADIPRWSHLIRR